MDQTTWVIHVLDDSNRKSIEYENRFWLRQHVKEMNIRVCVEDCNVGIREIEESYEEEGTILIQKGKHIQDKSDFNPKKEALLLLKRSYGYVIFQYFPEK